MRKAKGMIALGLCATMLLPVAAACGDGGDDKGEIELTFWTTGHNQQRSKSKNRR